ncbi:MAG TPA: 2,3-diaminopropionate biosynthesis protein SbnB [Thermoanaerobaculia bacterium]|nr:2,3-diaminopropionate biosynthesis protein SbnB [Thermoanaerobaculia bacterium]
MNKDDGILILGASDVASFLRNREGEVIEAVRNAYVAHGHGKSSLPHSTFLRFPDDEKNRIIALPAFLGDGFGVAGMKWISSFPGNLERGMARASAVLVLNSCRTGRPEAILEGSIISAQRTAASAAAAAHALCSGVAPAAAGLIGTGVINFEIARYLAAVFPLGPASFILYDLDSERASRFASRLRKVTGGADVQVAASLEAILESAPLVSFATTATRPHVSSLAVCPRGAKILHISLRDLTPEVILACDNVVDDVDHVCRAQTSIHLAEQAVGTRSFVRCTLADILEGRAQASPPEEKITVFSPFGLGILDLAVGKLVLDAALARGRERFVHEFLPGVEEEVFA